MRKDTILFRRDRFAPYDLAENYSRDERGYLKKVQTLLLHFLSHPCYP